MDAVAVEIHLEIRQLFLQVHGIPEERVVKKLAAQGPDESLHQQMR